MLRNSFKFGFELEAFAAHDIYCSSSEYNDECCNYLNEVGDEDLDDFYYNIKNHFKNEYGFYGNVHYDGSVRDYYDGYTSFEWSSPILNFTPAVLSKVKKMLYELNDNGIFINKTCGFHTHFSYDGITDGDVAWILLYIATNPRAFNLFTEFSFKKDGELFTHDVHFYNDRYANIEYLTNIGKCFLKSDYVEMAKYFYDDKYRVLRIHPQGTLEWRGPRDFLYSTDGIDKYIARLCDVVDVFIAALRTKAINGVSREVFLQNLKDAKFGGYDPHMHPELTLVEKRTNRAGIMNWFGDYRNPNRSININKMVENVQHNPSLINDEKYSDYIAPILSILNERNMLRVVIEEAYRRSNMLRYNVQYLMLSYNFTLLPYLHGDIWKYLPAHSIRQLASNTPFHNESDFKHKTLDYILTVLPNHYSYDTVECIVKFLTHKKWVVDYLLTKNRENLDKVLIGTIKSSCSDEYCCNKYIKKYEECIKELTNPELSEEAVVRKFRDLCDACYEPHIFFREQVAVSVSPNNFASTSFVTSSVNNTYNGYTTINQITPTSYVGVTADDINSRSYITTVE